jgi:hypothetical protein
MTAGNDDAVAFPSESKGRCSSDSSQRAGNQNNGGAHIGSPFCGADTPGLPARGRPHIIGPAPAFQGSLPVPKSWVSVAAPRKTL